MFKVLDVLSTCFSLNEERFEWKPHFPAPLNFGRCFNMVQRNNVLSTHLNHPEDCRQEAWPRDPCPNYVSPDHMGFAIWATGFVRTTIWRGVWLLFLIYGWATWSQTVAFVLHHHMCMSCSFAEVAWLLRRQKQERKHAEETLVQIMITYFIWPAHTDEQLCSSVAAIEILNVRLNLDLLGAKDSSRTLNYLS